MLESLDHKQQQLIADLSRAGEEGRDCPMVDVLRHSERLEGITKQLYRTGCTQDQIDIAQIEYEESL